MPGWFTPDVAVLELAVTALELTFHGRVEHRNSQYALQAAACIRGGLRPDLASDAGWWNTRLWIYAVYALVIYLRAAAERRGTSVQQVALDIAARHDLTGDIEQACDAGSEG